MPHFQGVKFLFKAVGGDFRSRKGEANLLTGMNDYLKAVVTLGVIAAIVVGGHFLSRPVFRFIAASRMREVFTASVLTLVVGIAALMTAIGLSPALGAFIAGVVLAAEGWVLRPLERRLGAWRA